MEKDYYAILGLSKGAGEKEIKRAYFKLVRQFSPEKDPERFQEIREAYENLQMAPQNTDSYVMECPDDPFASQFLEQIRRCFTVKNYKHTVKTAQEAIRYFGESEVFLFYLAMAQKFSGHPGVAAKNFEKLAARYPQKKEYQRHLAISYMDRGYGKKAYKAFQDAYAMGCRDPEFMILYSLCCNDRRQPDEAIRVLLELVEEKKNQQRNSVPDLIEAYSGLWTLLLQTSDAEYGRIADDFLDFLQNGLSYLRDYHEEVSEALLPVFMVHILHSRRDGETFRKIKKEALKILPKASGPRLMATLEQQAELFCIHKDANLSMMMKDCASACFNEYEDSTYVRFLCLDISLCLLEGDPDTEKEISVIKEKYPLYYSSLEKNLITSKNIEDRERLRARLLKDYNRLEKYFSGYGRYYRLFPESRAENSSSLWNSSSGTFVRQQPKVSRNAPCPCGSGKKYKNCCGKNA